MDRKLVPSPIDGRLQRIIRHIYQSGGTTRSELSQETGINPTSIIRLVTELFERGLLINADNPPNPSRRGRPSDILRINPNAGYGVGIEFGREHLVIAITNAIGEVIFWRDKSDVPSFVASKRTAHNLAAVIKDSVAEAGIAWKNVDALGLALHGVVSAQGEWVTMELFHAAPFPIKEQIQHVLKCETTVEDVSRAFAEAEYRFGAGKLTSDMIYVFLGSHGVGSGIFVNGRLLKSSSGVCGEIGHIIVEENGPLCYCGSHGCLEMVAAHQAVVEQFRSLLKQGVRTTLQDNPHLTFAKICEAAGAGDKGAYVVLHHLAQNMGSALASVINITGTPSVVIGGQLSLAGDTFLTDLASVVRHRAITLLAKDVAVSFAKLPVYAGAWGVAVQALEAVWMDGHLLSKLDFAQNGR